MTEAGKRTAQYLDGFDDGVEARAAVDHTIEAEAVAAERARIVKRLRMRAVALGWTRDTLASIESVIEGGSE